MFDKLSQLWRRLLFYARRDQFERELEEEMRFHLEMKNEIMAQRLWPGEDPVGKRFGRSLPGMGISLDTTVIGVAGNILRNGRESDAIPAYYTSARRLPWWLNRKLGVRTAATTKNAAARANESPVVLIDEKNNSVCSVIIFATLW